MIRILIADDHPTFRRGLELVLGSAPDIEILAQAETGSQAVDLAVRLVPDVILMDLRMPEIDGIEATRRVMRAVPDVAIVVLTMFDDDDSVIAALRAGARGYLLKGANEDEILRAVHGAAAGEAIFGSAVADSVIGRITQPDSPSTRPFPELTDREREVLDLVASGKGNASIAHDLGISLKTVRNHVSNIFTKIHVSERSAAIVRARQAGLGYRT